MTQKHKIDAKMTILDIGSFVRCVSVAYPGVAHLDVPHCFKELKINRVRILIYIPMLVIIDIIVSLKNRVERKKFERKQQKGVTF